LVQIGASVGRAPLALLVRFISVAVTALVTCWQSAEVMLNWPTRLVQAWRR
jgi:hypothetical protein